MGVSGQSWGKLCQYARRSGRGWRIRLVRKLTDYIIEIARERAIRKIYANVLKANSVMVEMFRRRGFTLTSVDHSTYFAELEVARVPSGQF